MATMRLQLFAKHFTSKGKNINCQRVELLKTDFPSYFKALENNRIIDIADAQNNKITAEFNESYLKPLGITSMLDVPIKAGGKTIGVICHEHTGEKRNWAIEEINFAVSLSDLLTKTIDAEKRIQAENELVKAKEKTVEERNRFFQVSLDMLCIAGTDGYFKYLNPAWEKTLGWTQEELKSKPFLDFIHPDDIESTLNEVAKLKTGAPTVNFSNRYQHKNGSYRWLNWVSTPYEDVLYASASDVTELKQIEESLKYSMQKLEQSNKELEQFAFVASHDLKEPLRKIKNYTELLDVKYKPKLDEKAEQYIKIITSGAERMETLISDLLSLSRVSTQGKEFTKVNMNEVVENVKEILELKIKEEKAQIIVDELPVVHGDSGQLMQVFQNLVGNALKFRGKLNPVVEIKAEDKGNNWLFKVQDNGIGFNADYTDKIFMMFQRLHSREQFEGTGIGLAICKKIIERHGGEISAHSKPGEGTTIQLTLPKNIITL